MFDLTRSLTLTLALSAAFAAPAFAQETTTEAPATEAPAEEAPATEAPAEPVPGTELSLGQEGGAPEPYVKATHGDWQLRCLRTEDGSDPCEIYQLLKDDKGNSVAEITMVALPDGAQAAAGATVVVPLETLLPPQLKIAIDGGKEKFYPYTFCAQVGCFSRIGFTAEEIEQMKKGTKAAVSVVPLVAPDQVVSVNVSLKGFTDAFEAVKAERPTVNQ